MRRAFSSLAQIIETHPVLVFSKTYCPYCSGAKSLLEAMEVQPHVVELDVDHQGPTIHSELESLTSQRTVPNIFIGGKHLGGFDALKAGLTSGSVQIKLDEAKVKFTFSKSLIE
jgi:glutaredoxin 3